MKRPGFRQLARGARARVLSLLDFVIPKAPDVWVFPVYFLGKGAFCDNSLAVLRSIRSDVNVKCFILSRDSEIIVEDDRCTVVRMTSYRAVWILLRGGVVFAQHSLWLDFAKAKFRISNLKNRVIVNLWHGIPIKDLSHSNTGIKTSHGLKEMPHYLIPCSSELDRRAMMQAFHASLEKNFWMTGIPRNDFLCCNESTLPGTYKKQLGDLRSKLSGHRLVLYVPTYRETPSGGQYFEFDRDQLQRLGFLLRKNSAILGVRFHSYRTPGNQAGLMNLEEVIDLSGTVVDDVRLLVRESSVVITDYSSIGLDALYAHVPLLSFAYDLDHYQDVQRGFFYDLNDIFGQGLVCQFGDLEQKLDSILSTDKPIDIKSSEGQIQFESQIFAYRDDLNGKRFADRLIDHVEARFGPLSLLP